MDSVPTFDTSTGVKRGDNEVGVVACSLQGTADVEQPATSERLRDM